MDQGALDVPVLGRLEARPVIVQIVAVAAFDDYCHVRALGDLFRARKQFTLAVITAVGVVGVIGRDGKLAGGDGFMPDPIRRASRFALSNWPAAMLGLVLVTATACSPKARCAALASTVLSSPPENATAQLP